MQKQTSKPIIKRIAISIPNEGLTQPLAYDNHLTFLFHLGVLQEQWKQQNRPIQYQFGFFTVGRLLTAMAREKLVSEALKANFDYILMIDDDMLLPPNYIESMIADIESKPEIDILAPLAFMRNPPHYAVIYTTIEGYDQKEHQAYYVNNFVKNYPKDKLVECDAVGFGSVLIKMDMVKKMNAPYFMSTTGTGEDIWFCVKAKQDVGARIFMDTRIKLGHLGNPRIIDEEYFQNYITETKHEILDVPYKYGEK
jgi:hypothetical protein